MNKEFAIESFISFCDDMMIAEESLSIIKTVSDTFDKKVEMIKSKLLKCKTASDQIKVFMELKSTLLQFRVDLEKANPNFFDTKFYRRLKDSLLIVLNTILIPFTVGISIIPLAYALDDFASAKSGELIKATLDQGFITPQIETCDMVINHIKSNGMIVPQQKGIVRESFSDYIDAKKQNRELRKENRDVRNQYKVWKSLNSKEKSNNNYEKIVGTVKDNEYKKKYSKECKTIDSIVKELIKEFTMDARGISGILFDVSSFEFNTSDNTISKYISMDVNNTALMFTSEYMCLNDKLEKSVEFVIRKNIDKPNVIITSGESGIATVKYKVL